MTQHAVRISGPDDDEVGLSHALHHRRKFDIPGLAHRAGIEGRKLIGLYVGRADEPRGVVHLADADRVRVDTVALEPGTVVLEIHAHRIDEHGAQAQARQAEGDVGGHSPAPDLECFDEEGQRDPVELVGDE